MNRTLLAMAYLDAATLDAMDIEDLAAHADWEFRRYAAKAERLPHSCVPQLVGDQHPQVLEAIAGYRALTAEQIRFLACSSHYPVRRAIARRDDTPNVILEMLSADEMERVAFAARIQIRARAINTDWDTLEAEAGF